MLKCSLLGHDLGDPVPIHMDDGKRDGTGATVLVVGYTVRICKRCRLRIPVTAEDAKKQAAKMAEIGAVMNKSRSHIGLRPIRWKDIS